MTLATVSLAVLLTGSSAQITSSDGLYSLRWAPKVGEVHLYRVKVKFDYGEGAMEFNSDLKVKVLAVAANGNYAIQTSTTSATLDSGNEVRELPAQPPVTQYYTKVGLPSGSSLQTRDPDPFADLLDHLTEFQAPPNRVRVKDSWINKPTGPKTGIFSQPRITYTFVDVFKDGNRHMAKIRYQAFFGMDSEAATGTLILDRSSNFLSQVDATIPHFKPEGVKEESSVSITLKEKL